MFVSKFLENSFSSFSKLIEALVHNESVHRASQAAATPRNRSINPNLEKDGDPKSSSLKR